MLYVALTRAKDRLYITGFTGKNESKESAWYDMVELAMQQHGQPVEEADGRVTLSYSEPQTADPDGLAGRQSREADQAALPDWARKPSTGESVPPKPLSPSSPDDAEPAVR